MFVSGQYAFGNGSVGSAALTIGNTKAGLEFVPAIALGMMCNALVCLAVWLTLQRPDDDRSDPRHRPADRRVRRGGLRAQRRQHVLHPRSDRDPDVRAG